MPSLYLAVSLTLFVSLPSLALSLSVSYLLALFAHFCCLFLSIPLPLSVSQGIDLSVNQSVSLFCYLDLLYSVRLVLSVSPPPLLQTHFLFLRQLNKSISGCRRLSC